MSALLDSALRDVHPTLGVHPVFFTVDTRHVSYVMSILESYESVGVTRSHDPAHADGRVLMVAMIVPDFADVARALFVELAGPAEIEFVEATRARIADLQAVLDGADDDQRRRNT